MKWNACLLIKRLVTNREVQILGSLALLAWLAHYWYFRDFGLYVDDYNHFAEPFDWSISQIAQRVYTALRYLPQGRPFHYSVTYAVGSLSFQLGGLALVHVIGFLVVAANGWMIFTIIKLLTGSPRGALLGALLFLLYPLPTTHSWLSHSLNAFPSLLVFQVAVWCYLKDRRLWAYVLIVVVLFYYETPYPVFALVPFLKKNWRWREVIFTAAYLAAWLLIAYLLRRTLADDRVLNLDFIETTRRIMLSVIEGPITSLTAWIFSTSRLITRLQVDVIVAIVVGYAIIWWMLGHTTYKVVVGRARIMLIGLAILPISYILSFIHYPPNDLIGPPTSIHIGAVFGIALMASVLFQRVPIPVTALVFALMLGYRVTIQHDYRDGWAFQRSFWTQVLAVAPDLENETVIVVNREVADALPYGYGVDWSMHVVLSTMFRFPRELYSQMPYTLTLNGNRLGPHWVEDNAASDLAQFTYIQFNIRDGNVIVLNWEDGILTRSPQPTVIIDGRVLNTKPLGASVLETLERRPLYDLIVQGADMGLSDAR